MGIENVKSRIYDRRGNGVAEREVKTVKRGLPAWSPNLNVSNGALLKKRKCDTSQEIRNQGPNFYFLQGHF